MASSNTDKNRHPVIEGIIPNAQVGDKSSSLGTPATPAYGVAPQPGFAPSQGHFGQGAYGNQPGNYPPPSQGNYGQPPVNYGPATTYGPGGQVNYGPLQPGYGPPQGGFATPPISTQPLPRGTIPTANNGWMSMPQNALNCPPGLEYLTMIDQLLVHQQVEILEIITKYETENKFTIHNSLGQKVYKALENSDAFMRNCCGSFRPFEMRILDNFDKPVIHLSRPFACQSCCCPCFLQKMEVSSPPGVLIGTIEQEWSFWIPKFAIKNSNGDVVLRIEGPYCTMDCSCGDVDFKVLTAEGSNQVGKISKKWTGYAQENFTDADNFGINFPMDLDVRMKAVMLGACFLIDMMYYEKTGNQNQRTAANRGGGATTVNRA